MPVKYYNEFQYFSESFSIKYVENGLFSGDDWRYEHIIRPYHRLYIVLDGQGEIFMEEDEPFILEKGMAYMIPAQVDFSCNSPKYLRKLYAHFIADSPFSKSIFDDRESIMKMPIDIDAFELCFEQLETNAVSGYYHVKGLYDGLIYEFINQLSDHLVKHHDLILTPLLKQVYSMIELDLTAKLRTNEIAKRLNITQSSLSKQFKNTVGKPLKQYLQEQLMRKAQILLLTTKLSIQEIAYQLGYDDNLYFSRAFHNKVGLSPTHYRKVNGDHYKP